MKGVQWNCVSELTLARGLLCLPTNQTAISTGLQTGSPKMVSTRQQLEDLFTHVQAKIDPAVMTKIKK